MPDWATIARGALGAAVRRIGNGAHTRPAFAKGYEVVARAGAAWLARVPHVDAVYLSGSLLTPEAVAPGVSDIDLVLVARLPTSRAELEFRAALKKRLGQLNRAAPVFYNLEYLDAADVPFLLAFGNAWIADFTRAFRLLQGTPVDDPGVVRPLEELRCERLIHSLWKWRKVVPAVLDRDLRAEPWVRARAAERMLAIVTARGSDEHARGAIGAAHAMNEPSPKEPVVTAASTLEHPMGARRSLVATLEALEHLAAECTPTWGDAWTVEGAAVQSEPSAEHLATASTLLRHGFQSVCVVPRDLLARTASVIAVAHDGEPREDVVSRAERAFAALERQHPGSRPLERPLVLTRPLWNAAALLEPSPFTGGRIASGQCCVVGSRLPAPKSPPPELLRALLRARATDLFYKPRGRQLRLGKLASAERLAADLRLAPAIAESLDTGVLQLGTPTTGELHGAFEDDSSMIPALRRWIEGRRAALAPELQRRRL